MIDFAPCTHDRRKKFGKTSSGEQRYRCCACGKTFTESTDKLAGMRIGMDKAARIIEMLCEGNSVAATARMTDTDPHTILDLLLVTGERCKRFMERKIRGLAVDDVQVDEVYQFVYCKRRTAEKLEQTGFGGRCGDSWTFTAVERNTKLVIAWHFGRRYQADADEFCRKLRVATVGHFHLSTDGYQPYVYAVPRSFAGQIDYGMLVKIFGKSQEEGTRGYNPPRIISARKEVVMGTPDESRICTSHTERNNGSMRLFIKRMNRLTYAFSKKWANHEMALALHFCHFNFCRRHKTLSKGKGPTSPAMASKLADHVWTVREMLEAIAA